MVYRFCDDCCSNVFERQSGAEKRYAGWSSANKFRDALWRQKPNFIADYQKQVDYLKLANQAIKDFVLLPENAVGRWTENNMMVWADLAPQKQFLVGASIYDTKPTSLRQRVIENHIRGFWNYLQTTCACFSVNVETLGKKRRKCLSV